MRFSKVNMDKMKELEDGAVADEKNEMQLLGDYLFTTASTLIKRDGFLQPIAIIRFDRPADSGESDALVGLEGFNEQRHKKEIAGSLNQILDRADRKAKYVGFVSEIWYVTDHRKDDETREQAEERMESGPMPSERKDKKEAVSIMVRSKDRHLSIQADIIRDPSDSEKVIDLGQRRDHLGEVGKDVIDNLFSEVNYC